MSEVYFLGAMTANGFSTEFGKIMEKEGMFTYILKGGAGTGKSSLMKRIAAHFEDAQHIQRFYCSSDPASLDAVVLTGSKVAVVDGTSPHVFDPAVPGVKQKIVNLGDFWDEGMLRAAASDISCVTAANKSMLSRAARFTSAVSNICSDTYQIGLDCILSEKLDSFVERFKKKLLGKKGSGSGEKHLRQLTALTEYGIMTQTDTLEDYFDIYIINDDYYAAADYLLSLLGDEAAARGYDVMLCPAQLFNNSVYEHLLIPEQGIALVSGRCLGECDIPEAKRLNLGRFYDKKLIAQRKPRLKMNNAASKDLMGEAADTIKSAKQLHDELESYYISAMDFEKIDKTTEKIISEIENIRSE